MINKLSKKLMAIVMTLAMAISLLLALTLTVMAASGAVTFNAINQTNIGTVLHDGTYSNDISGIQLDIFNTNDIVYASNPTLAGSFVYLDAFDAGTTNGAFMPIAGTSGTDLSSVPPKILVIKSNDGSEFSFQSIYISDSTYDENSIKFEGFRNGVSTGYVVLNKANVEETYNDATGLTSSQFGYVDEVRITNQQGGDMASGNWAGFNNIVIGEPVVPVVTITSQSVKGGAAVTVKSSKTGYVYLVDNSKAASEVDTAAELDALVTAGTATKAMITAADTNMMITVPAAEGSYAAVGLSLDGYVSAKNTNLITVDNTAPSAPSSPDLMAASDSGTSSTDNITSDTTPTFTGTAEAGSVVKLYDTDGITVLGTVIATGGNWSITSSTLSEGVHTLMVKATDAAGNIGSASSPLSVIIDTAAPTITFGGITLNPDTGTSSTDFITNATAQTIKATLSGALDGTDIVYGSLDNGSTWTDITNKVSGTMLNWNGVTLSSSNTLRFKVTDFAGNNGTAASQAYVLDTTGPMITFSNTAFSADTGASSTDFITNIADQTIVATLSAAPGGTDIVYGSLDNGNTWTDITDKVSGTTLFWNGVTLSGGNTFKLKVTDIAGNDSTITSQAYILDIMAPSAPSAPDMTSGTDSGASNTDNITSNSTPTLIGTTEANSTVTLYDTNGTTVLGTAMANSSGNWSITSSVLSDGNHSISVKATDAAGNTGAASSSLIVKIDTTAPAAPSAPDLSAASDTGASNTDDITSVTTPTFMGTAEPSSTVRLYDTDGTTLLGTGPTDGSGNWSITSSVLSTGTHTITAKAADAAGNTGVASASYSVTIVTSAPTTTVASAALSADTGSSNSDFITKTAAQTISGTLSANLSSGEIVEVSLDNGSTWATVTSTVGQNTWVFSGQLLTGSNTMRVRVTNTVGLSGSALVQAYILDATVPTVAITSTAGSFTNTSLIPVTITFSQSVTGFDTSNIIVANGTKGTLSGSGALYSLDITPSGQGTVTVDIAAGVAVDAAGNINTAAAQLSLLYDSVSPIVTISSTAPSTTNASPIPVTVTFNEAVTGFDASDITVTNGTKGSLSGSGSTYSINITPSGQGAVKVNIAAGVAVDAAGNSNTAAAELTRVYDSIGPAISSPSPSSTAVIVNVQAQDAGTSSTITNASGQRVTTITVDDRKLNAILESNGDKPAVTLTGSVGADVVVGELNGQNVKNMEKKAATLVIKTDTVTYTLPASQIDIDGILEQLGKQVALKDIKVSVKIAESSADTVKIVEDTANKNNYQLVIPPIEFEITCTYGDKTIKVSKFNGYVERIIAIPDNVDPSKITTGIVLNADGTFRSVPTEIVKINGKYYAKINSLTNSTYSAIYNPVTFVDVTNHWAKDAINDMGSRMVVAGTGNGAYEPDKSISRAEFAAIVVRALGLAQDTTESSFSDVSLKDWFNGYVDTATSYGLINGYSSASYNPNDTITREQAMAILARAMKIVGLNITLTDSEVSTLLSGYTDGASVSDYAKESAALCLKYGVVTGTSTTTLAPKAYVTRAEVAVMVQRLLQKSGLI